MRPHTAGESFKKSDHRDNTTTRLPATEAIHLGGLVLTEAFTPSTVSALYKALKDLPTDRDGDKQEWLAELARSRRGAYGGWRNLSVIRRPGDFLFRDGYTDPALPEGVEAVWLHLNYTIPSLTMLVATFTLTEEAGDLSALLREDYQTKLLNINVGGRCARLRAKLPGARPAPYRLSYSISRAEDQKGWACDALIRQHEEACRRWFTARFPGRFSLADPKSRPMMRLMFTQEQVPFKERKAIWLRPVGLHHDFDVWRSTESPGWALSLSPWPYRHGQQCITVAARRRDVAQESIAGESEESNWHLTQGFDTDQAPLAVQYAMTSLLSIYGDRLGDLRDRMGVKSRPRRPVRQARELDQYLIGDGLDAATITADIRLLTENVTWFRRHVLEYTEDLDGYPPDRQKERQPRELVSFFCDWLSNQATRLSEDSTTTTGNIRASAELRQAIANTKLQRMLFVLAIVATTAAVVAAIISLIAQS